MDTSLYVQNVLLEDYSGHRCPNCPNAAVYKTLPSTYNVTNRYTYGPIPINTSIVNLKHCNVIAYVYNATTCEVIQVVSKNMLTP